MSTAEASTPKLSSSYAAGFIAGLVNAAGFNWYDKGLYEAIKHKRPFFVMEELPEPLAGISRRRRRQDSVVRILVSAC